MRESHSRHQLLELKADTAAMAHLIHIYPDEYQHMKELALRMAWLTRTARVEWGELTRVCMRGEGSLEKDVARVHSVVAGLHCVSAQKLMVSAMRVDVLVVMEALMGRFVAQACCACTVDEMQAMRLSLQLLVHHQAQQGEDIRVRTQQ